MRCQLNSSGALIPFRAGPARKSSDASTESHLALSGQRCSCGPVFSATQIGPFAKAEADSGEH